MRSIGADEVIDYRSEDFTAGPYDLILDLVAHGRCRLPPALAPAAATVASADRSGAAAGPDDRWLAGRLAHRRWRARRKEGPEHFEPVADLCVAGDLTIHIDRTFALDDVPAPSL